MSDFWTWEAFSDGVVIALAIYGASVWAERMCRAILQAIRDHRALDDRP